MDHTLISNFSRFLLKRLSNQLNKHKHELNTLRSSFDHYITSHTREVEPHNKNDDCESQSTFRTNVRDGDSQSTLGTNVRDGESQSNVRDGESQLLSVSNMLKYTFIKLLKLYFTPMTKFSLTMIHCVTILDESHLYVYGDHICYTNWQYGIMLVLLPCILMFPVGFEIALRLLKEREISSWEFVLAAICPPYSLLLYLWKRKCGIQAKFSSSSISWEESEFRRTIVEGEEVRTDS